MVRPTASRLGELRSLSAVAIALVIALPVVQSASCSVHEVAHAAVGSALGWQVEAIELCPFFGGGRVSYAASTGGLADDLESYAGGTISAGLLALLDGFAFVRTRAPVTSPVWWTVGLVVAWGIGAQLLVGTLEGVVAPGEDYADLFTEVPAVVVPPAVVAMGAGPVVHV